MKFSRVLEELQMKTPRSEEEEGFFDELKSASPNAAIHRSCGSANMPSPSPLNLLAMFSD